MKNINIAITLIVGISFYCYEFFLRILTGAYQEEIIHYFNITSHTGFSFLVSSYNITYLLMQIPAGFLLDRFGSKKILIWATLICGAGNILFIVDGFYLAIVGRLLVGIGSSFAFIGVLKLARETLQTKHFAIVASIVISLGTLAAAFSQQLSVYISENGSSWISVFVYSGLIAVPLAILFLIFLPKNNPATLMPNISNIFGSTKDLLKNKTLWINATWASLIYIPTVILTSQYGISYLKDIHNIDKIAAASLITSIFMGWVIFSPIVNIISSKFGIKKTVIIGVFGMVITMIAISNNNLSEHLLLLTFLFGSFSAVQVLVWHYFNKICSSSISGLGIAVTNMIITLIVELGQLSTGMLIDLFNRFDISPNITITYSFIVFTILGYMVYRKLKVD